MAYQTQKGFTLIELLVVIAIIGVLAAIVLPSLSTARKLAQISQARQELIQIRNAIGALSADTGLWPRGKVVNVVEAGTSCSTNEIWDLNNNVPITSPPACVGLVVGLVATDGAFPAWNGPYMKTVPLDPWGNPYFFDTDYRVKANDDPCPPSPADQTGCVDVAALGSFGPDGIGQNLYNADDVILILAR